MDVMDGDFKMMVKYLFHAIGRDWMIYCSGLDTIQKSLGFRFMRAPLKVEVRLRYAYQAILLVEEAFGKDVSRVWLFKKNRNLNWESPADTFRYSDNLSKLSRVIEVAQKFVISR